MGRSTSAATAERHAVSMSITRGRTHLAEIDPRAITIDRKYQRDLNSAWLDANRPFDPDLAGATVLSARGGKLFGVDGQHRTVLAVESNEVTINCIVIEGLTQKEEAALFVKYQVTGRRLSSYALFRANTVAEDPDTLAISAVVRQAGFRIPTSGHVAGPQDIKAVEALRYVYSLGGVALLSKVLDLIHTHWYSLPQAVSSGMVRGLGQFVQWASQHPTGLVDDRLDRVLAELTPTRIGQLSQIVAAERSVLSGTKTYNIAEAIRREYDKRTPKAAAKLGPVPNQKGGRTR